MSNDSEAVPSGKTLTFLGITKTPFSWFALVMGPIIYFAFLAAPFGGTQQG